MSKDFLIKELDRVFSIAVRKRDADEFEMILCPCCKLVRRHWSRMQCGHFRKRRHLTTRWMLCNAVGICEGCNNLDVDLTVIIDQRFGPGTAEELTQLSHKEWHPTEREIKKNIDRLTKLL